jgi:hypothetical protein
MRLPQVSERIKEAPGQALRGVFAGIGQLLLIADKLRNKTPAGQQVSRARGPERSEMTTPASPVRPAQPAPAAADTAAADPEKAGRTAARVPPTAARVPPTAARVPPTAARVPPTAARVPPAARVTEARDLDKTGNVRLLTSQEAGAGGMPPTAAAPLPNYDELSVASLRARLRNLDVTQVRELAEYEQAHAARPDVLAMYERRIAKLETQRSDDARGEAAAEAEIEARTAVEAGARAELEAEAEGEA